MVRGSWVRATDASPRPGTALLAGSQPPHTEQVQTLAGCPGGGELGLGRRSQSQGCCDLRGTTFNFQKQSAGGSARRGGSQARTQLGCGGGGGFLPYSSDVGANVGGGAKSQGCCEGQLFTFTFRESKVQAGWVGSTAGSWSGATAAGLIWCPTLDARPRRGGGHSPAT